jgi:hypothetical protein
MVEFTEAPAEFNPSAAMFALEQGFTSSKHLRAHARLIVLRGRERALALNHRSHPQF